MNKDEIMKSYYAISDKLLKECAREPKRENPPSLKEIEEDTERGPVQDIVMTLNDFKDDTRIIVCSQDMLIMEGVKNALYRLWKIHLISWEERNEIIYDIIDSLNEKWHVDKSGFRLNLRKNWKAIDEEWCFRFTPWWKEKYSKLKINPRDFSAENRVNESP